VYPYEVEQIASNLLPFIPVVLAMHTDLGK